MQKNLSKTQQKILCYGGSTPQPLILFDWIAQANWLSDITGYRFWIRFAKSRRCSRLSIQFTRNFEYKHEHVSNTKNRKNCKNCHFLQFYKNFERPYLKKYKSQKSENWFFICYRTLCIFLNRKPKFFLAES